MPATAANSPRSTAGAASGPARLPSGAARLPSGTTRPTPRGVDLRRRIWRVTWRRALAGAVVLVFVSALTFALAAASPFDPLVTLLGAQYEHTSAAQRADLAARLGTDLPWWRQWAQWLSAGFSGDWGFSQVYAQPVTQVLAERLPWTLLLSGCGLAGALLLALLGARVAARNPGGWLDNLLVTATVALQAIPPFVVALAAVIIFAVTLGWLPSSGAFPATGEITVATIGRHLLLPAAVLALTQCPWLVLSLHRAVTEATTADPVRAARLRGLDERTVFTRHTLPAALGPWIGLAGTRLPELVAGSVLIEAVFGWPGVAAAFIESAKSLDFALLAALVTATTAVVLAGSWAADVAHMAIDPRVSHVS